MFCWKCRLPALPTKHEDRRIMVMQMNSGRTLKGSMISYYRNITDIYMKVVNVNILAELGVPLMFAFLQP